MEQRLLKFMDWLFLNDRLKNSYLNNKDTVNNYIRINNNDWISIEDSKPKPEQRVYVLCENQKYINNKQRRCKKI